MIELKAEAESEVPLTMSWRSTVSAWSSWSACTSALIMMACVVAEVGTRAASIRWNVSSAACALPTRACAEQTVL